MLRLVKAILKLFVGKRKTKFFLLSVILAICLWKFHSTYYKPTYSIETLKKSLNELDLVKFVENIYASPNETLIENKTSPQVTSSQTTVASSNIGCNPILANIKQYTVLIDGVQYPTQVPLHKNVSIDFKRLDASSTKKLILFYNTWFDDKGYEIGLGYRTPFNKSGCPVTSCETTDDKRRLNESDFVITHMRDSLPVHLPSFRPKNQRWIFLLYVIDILRL